MNTLALNGAAFNGSAALEVEEPLPPDPLAAVEWAFHGFAPLPGAVATPSTLAVAFGEAMVERPDGSGKWRGSRIRRGEAPPGTTLPYVVLHSSVLSEPEPVQGDSDAFGQAIRLDCHVFASPESEAVRLAKAVRRFFASRGGCPPLEWEGGRESARFPSAGEAEMLPPQMGPEGQWIHGRRVTIEFRLVFVED